MAELNPAIGTLYVVLRASLRAFKLHMFVVIYGGAETNTGQETTLQVVFTLGIDAGLFQVYPDRSLFFRNRLAGQRGFLSVFLMPRNPVFAVECAQ